jgi:hypothetical protein
MSVSPLDPLTFMVTLADLHASTMARTCALGISSVRNAP